CPSNASSCLSCHEVQGAHSVLRDAQPWHADHAFGDLCAACHSGDPSAPAHDAAHAGLQRPLDDPFVSCASCHAADYATRADRYRAALSVAAPSPLPSAPPSGPASPPAVEARRGAGADRALTVLAASLGLALYFVLRGARSQPGRALLSRLRDKTWSPYAAGTLLGAVVAFSEVFCGRTIAASGAFDRLAAYPGRWLFPESQYYGHLMAPAITWQVWLVAGVVAGAWASSKLSGEVRRRWLPDTQWVARFGASRPRRLAIAFGGAVLVQIGAGIAGGCTSGLAISGGAALAPAAFIFMAGMFAGGIPTAWLWYRKEAG
ncbi:MAG TPA: YeeE/YedE thiosulfate transporter family protein, partial [Polyangiaceae bacterium]|nr:YeeE/YedE thiosulfate transporter family protein [Polyangiaceae bacterium]